MMIPATGWKLFEIYLNEEFSCYELAVIGWREKEDGSVVLVYWNGEHTDEYVEFSTDQYRLVSPLQQPDPKTWEQELRKKADEPKRKEERRLLGLKLFTEGKTIDDVYVALMIAFPDLPISKEAVQKWHDKGCLVTTPLLEEKNGK